VCQLGSQSSVNDQSSLPLHELSHHVDECGVAHHHCYG
jgi:hypothetical protein